MSTKHYLNQAGNSIHGHFQNHGVQLNGNNISVGGNFTINTHLNEKNIEKECRKALRNGLSDPIDDRAKILSLKPRMVTATCDWITENARYKTWRNIRTRSQLLWISGGQARGKTMLAIFLTQEFDRLAKKAGEITVLYYFIDRQDGRDTAVHVMRGLIWRLVAVRKNLISHLLEEYENQPDSLFGPNSIETLWRVFENMVRDTTAGQVYCVIDGLDSCTEDSLRRLIGRIRDFFLDEPQTIVDESGPDDSYRQARSTRRPPIKEGAGLKMMLVSREEPQWLIEELKDFPRIPLGGGSKKAGKAAAASNAKPAKQPPKLADVAKSIIRKQTLQKATNTVPATAGPSSATVTSQACHSHGTTFSDITSALTSQNGLAPNGSASGNQMAFNSGGMVLTSGSSPINASLSASASTNTSNGALVLANASNATPGSSPLSPQLELPSTSQPATEASFPQHQLALPGPSEPASSHTHTQQFALQTPSKLTSETSSTSQLALPGPTQSTMTPTPASQQACPSNPQITSAPPTSTSQFSLPSSASPAVSSSESQLVSSSFTPQPTSAPSTASQYNLPSSVGPTSNASVSHVVPPSITHQLTNEAPPAYNQQEVGVSATSATAATVSQTQAASQGPAEFRTDLPSHIQNQGVLSDGVNTSPDTHAKLSGMTSTSHHVFQGAEHTYEQGEFTDEKRAQPAASVEDATPGGAETAEEAEDDDDDDFNPSLRLYIEARIEELSKEKQYTTAVQSFICAALEYRGDGTFLWVDFAVEELKKIQVDVIEDTVNSLPPALDEMYSRILINIDPSLVDLVVGLLRWTVCARRPMDLLELTVALNLSHFGNQNAMAFILNAVTACGNMIKIGEEDLTVNLVHQSVVDFLTGEDSQLLSDPRLARFHIRPSQIDGDIATFCISYLESGPFNEKAICQAQNAEEYNQHILQHPFVPYAASFWPDHLKEASNPTLNLSSPFFLPKSKARKNWWKTYWAFTTGKATWVAPTNFNVLHLAAYLNLVSVAQQVAQRGELQSRLNKRDSHGMTPLDYTVAMGHIPMFMFLVQQGAKQEPLGETILELAVRKGQRDMVALLLDMGWNVNLRAQQLTPMGSLYTMTRWLPGAFNEGLDLNRDTWSMMFKDVGVQETPLHQSATFGHLAVMELLLERGADISAGTTKGFTPLHSASYTGHLQCVELLVERGANVNWVTTEQWLPLHYAAMRGKTAVVEFFLDLGVPIDSLNIKAKTALHLAAYAGHAELVQILVERGANVELKSYKGETPLHLATRHTKPQIVELLLSLGADRSAVTNEGVTALQMAQASTLIDAKECLRILQTYGMEGYVPWQPPQQQNVAQQSGQGDTSAQDTQTAQNEQTTTAGVETANEDAGARRASMAPTARTFGHTAVPRAATFQGFEANISVQVHPPQQPSYGSPVPQHPMQSMEPGQGTGGFATMQPNFGGPYSDPAAGGSKFSYDANVNMPQYMGKDNGVAYGAMSPPSAPPPPYTAAVGVSPSPALPEKSPAWTAQMNQSSMQPNLPMQATPLAPSSPPTQSASTFQMMPSTHPWPSGSSQTPVPQAQAASAPITPAPQSSSSSMVQMLSSMAISTPASPSPATQTPQISTPGPAMQPPPTPIVQAQQPYQSQANPQYHAPATPNIQAASPAPLMSPFQPAATPLSPYQPPATPVQQYPQQQQQSQFQTPVSPIQPVQQQPPPSPMHYTAGLNLTSAHSPYNSPPIQQPSQFLSPITTPYGRQQQGPAPVQSPHFSGNSTASTFNSSYTYSAPAVSAPYNPNLGQMPMQPGGPWQGQPNNGMMFAPPPPQGQKKKSFLGGLVPGR